MDQKGKPPTGHDRRECTSALQKAVRRGMADMAMQWLLELEEAGEFSWAIGTRPPRSRSGASRRSWLRGGRPAARPTKPVRWTCA